MSHLKKNKIKFKQKLNIKFGLFGGEELKPNLTFIGPCVANIFAEYNQQDATFHNLFIYFCKNKQL